jgi:hypothetical protein
MGFLHLWMLWFLPLALVPVLLHLLTLHRLRTVELPTFRFLFDSYIQQRRRMRFLEALLAMLRVLFMLFLVFLVCRPVVKHWDQLFGGTTGSGGREVILLVDCSASMNAKSAGVSSIDRARTTALSIIDRLRPADQVTLIRVGARPEEILSRFNTDTEGIRNRIRALEPGSSRANLFAALLQLFGPEAGRRSNPAVYVFTDCQANSWKEAKNQGLEKLIPEGTAFTVVNVGPTAVGDNVAVVGDAPRRNRAIAGLPFVLTPRVVNHGRVPAEVTLSVLINEKEVARTLVTVKPGETLTRNFTYTPPEPGLEKGRFVVATKTPDVFPDDDQFLFALEVKPKIKVAVINGSPSEDPLLDEAAYIATALSSQAEPPADDKKPAVPGTKDLSKALDVREIPQAALGIDTLRDTSVVVLANCGALNAVQFGYLRAFVRDGGGLLIFPGDKVVPATYTTSFFPIPGPQGESLTAATMQPAVGDPDKGDTYAGLDLDFSHPALSVFDPKESFRTVQVYRHFPLGVPKGKVNAWPIAYFQGTKNPAIVESKLGDGVVLLAAFPAHPRWGNLPLKPDFVPLMLRLVTYAEHRPEAEVTPVVVADGTAEVAVSATWEPADATVKLPSGALLPPITLERSGARLFGAIEQTSRRGYYTVDVRSGRTNLLKAASLAFAVNQSPEESDFTLLKEADIRKLLPAGVEMTFIDASAQAQELHGNIGKEQELWQYLIWLLFIVIGVEFMLSTLSGHKRPEEEVPSVGERVLSAGTGAWVGKMTGAPGKE